MQIMRVVAAFMVLMGLTLFIQANTSSIGTGGSGYVFIGISLVSFAALAVTSFDILNFVLLKRSALFLLAYLAWFGIKFTFESTNPLETREVLVGSTNGVLFALGLGFIASYALSALYSERKSKVGAMLVGCGSFGYIAVTLFFTLGTLRYYLTTVTGDIFLIEDNEGAYQRVGDLLFMQLLLVVSVACVVLSTAKRFSFIVSLPLTIMVLCFAALCGITSQVVGSNAGLAAALASIVVYLICLFVIMLGLNTGSRVSILNLLFGSLGVKILFSVLVSLVALGLVILGLVKVFNFDVNTLRVFNYGSGGTTSSIESRSDLFVDFFSTQLAYSPVFGHTQVDKLTTGEGSYAHSLVAMLPHLGLVGVVLFLLLLFSMYKQVTSLSRNSIDTLYSNSRYSLFRLLGLGSVLTLAMLFKFYIWMPLWFSIALFGDWFYQNTEIRQLRHSNSRRRRRKYKS